VAVRLVLYTAALAAGRLLDLARRAHETPVRSRSELLAELLMSDTAINEDLLERARALAIPVTGWHVVVRIEADDLEESGRDEVHRFELMEAAGQAALQAAAATGGTWCLTRIARAIVLVRVTTSNPGPQAGARAARSAERALQAIRGRLPSLRFRAGVGAPHEGPTGLRASAAEARGALLAARAALKPAGVAAHDAVGVRRMLMEWYASDTARASVRDQLAPLERLGRLRRHTVAIRGVPDEQGVDCQDRAALHHHHPVANRCAARSCWRSIRRQPGSAARPAARMSCTAAGLADRAVSSGGLPAASAGPGSSRAAQTAFSPVPRMVHPQATASAPTICRPWPDSASGPPAARAGGVPVWSVTTQIRRLA
jgi:hypothetical protein